MPDTVLGTGDASVKKTYLPHRTHFGGGRGWR